MISRGRIAEGDDFGLFSPARKVSVLWRKFSRIGQTIEKILQRVDHWSWNIQGFSLAVYSVDMGLKITERGHCLWPSM